MLLVTSLNNTSEVFRYSSNELCTCTHTFSDTFHTYLIMKTPKIQKSLYLCQACRSATDLPSQTAYDERRMPKTILFPSSVEGQIALQQRMK